MVDYKNKDVRRMRVLYRMARFILKQYDLSIIEVRKRDKCKRLAEPRMIAMYILHNKGFQPCEVAYLFKRDHSTVVKNYERMRGLLKYYPQDYELVFELEKSILSTAHGVDWKSVVA